MLWWNRKKKQQQHFTLKIAFHIFLHFLYDINWHEFVKVLLLSVSLSFLCFFLSWNAFAFEIHWKMLISCNSIWILWIIDLMHVQQNFRSFHIHVLYTFLCLHFKRWDVMGTARNSMLLFQSLKSYLMFVIEIVHGTCIFTSLHIHSKKGNVNGNSRK